MIANACSGVPLKSPVQKEVKSGLMSGKTKSLLKIIVDIVQACTFN